MWRIHDNPDNLQRLAAAGGGRRRAPIGPRQDLWPQGVYRSDVGPAMTMTELRAQLEEGLSILNEIKLFHGNHELLDGTTETIEL